MTRVLKDFLVWLQDVEPGLSQTDIARRAHLSQSVVNKIMMEVGTREPEPSTYRAIAEAFPGRWREFLMHRPGVAWELFGRYSWAVVNAEPPQRRKAG